MLIRDQSLYSGGGGDHDRISAWDIAISVPKSSTDLLTEITSSRSEPYHSCYHVVGKTDIGYAQYLVQQF
jgi:hypothetical protein